MKVKNILVLSAKLTGQDEIAEYLEKGVAKDFSACEQETEKLLYAYNMTIYDLAADYAPLIKIYEKENAMQVYYSEFSDHPLDVYSVCDEKGNELAYEHNDSGIAFDKLQNKVIVKYFYVPDERGLNDECDYGDLDRITPRAISLGVAAEYLRAKGIFSQAAEMQKKFEESVRACVRPKGKLVLPKRRWV